MVFSNEDYLKAFPRTEKPVAAPAAAPVSTSTPGDALKPEPEELPPADPADPAVDDLPDPAAEEGGAADGDE